MEILDQSVQSCNGGCRDSHKQAITACHAWVQMHELGRGQFGAGVAGVLAGRAGGG